MRVMHLKSEIAQMELSDLDCGEGGIRTHGGHKSHNGFRDRPVQPLWHLSSTSRGLIIAKNEGIGDRLTGHLGTWAFRMSGGWELRGPVILT